MIVIDSSDLDNDDMFEDPQLLKTSTKMTTALRPKKSKGMHAGAALYISANTMQSGQESSLFIAPVPGDPYR